MRYIVLYIATCIMLFSQIHLANGQEIPSTSGYPTRVIHLSDYGAKGDGKTLDALSFQQAIKAAPPQGAIITGKPGAVYLLDKTLLISKPIVFDFKFSQILTRGDFKILFHFKYKAIGNREHHLNNVGIRNVKIIGEISNSNPRRRLSSGTVFYFEKVDHSFIEHAYIENIKGSVIKTDGWRESTVYDLHTRFCGSKDAPTLDFYDLSTSYDRTNNIFLNSIFTIYSFGPAWRFGTKYIATGKSWVRNIYIINSLTHGLLPQIDGTPFSIPNHAKTSTMLEIFNAEGIIFTNSRFIVAGSNAPAIKLQKEASGSPKNIRIVSCDIRSHYDNNSDGNSIGIYVLDGNISIDSTIIKNHYNGSIKSGSNATISLGATNMIQ